jgi:hypothetical protein
MAVAAIDSAGFVAVAPIADPSSTTTPTYTAPMKAASAPKTIVLLMTTSIS